jgi:tellurite resistance protein
MSYVPLEGVGGGLDAGGNMAVGVVVIVVTEDAGVLIASLPGAGGPRLPGAPVDTARGVEATARGVLPPGLVPAGGRLEFVGCVEHGVVADVPAYGADGGNLGDADLDSDDSGADDPELGADDLDDARHSVTLLFACEFSARDAAAAHDVAATFAGTDLGGARFVPISDFTTAAVRPARVGSAVSRWLAERFPVWTPVAAPVTSPRWYDLRGSALHLRAQILARRAELRDGAFRDATVAMCALVAAADGYIHPAERETISELIMTDEILSAFDHDDLRRCVAEYLGRMQTDFAEGRRAALAEIGRLRGSDDRAHAVIQAGILIAHADGFFSEEERRVIRDAFDLLDLPPEEFPIQATVGRP